MYYMASQILRLARFSLLIPLVIFILFPLLITVSLATIFLGFVVLCSGELGVLCSFRVAQPVRSPVTSKHQRTQTDALARKAARRGRDQLRYALPLAASKATTRLPRNNEYFGVAGHQTYSGKDIRRAVFATHVESVANIQRTQSQIRRHSPLKPFRNYGHRIPHTFNMKPLNSMQGRGHEFPIGPYTNRQKGPARVVVQFKNGHTELQGVVARDVSRAVDSPGSSDHFEVTPDSVDTFWELGETFINAESTTRRGTLRASLSYFVGL